MSLIQEALRRQQEEFGDEGKPSSGAQPAPAAPEQQPTPTPAAKPAQQPLAPAPASHRGMPAPATPPLATAAPKRKVPVLTGALGIMLFLLLLVGATVLLVALVQRQMTPKKAPPEQVTQPPPASVTPAGGGGQPAQTQPQQPAPPAQPAPGPAVSAQDQPSPAPPSPRQPDSRALRPSETKLQWPKLRLSGIMTKMGSKGSCAILNGRFIGLGESILGARLLEIQADTVFLQFKSEVLRLKVGESSK